jgi:hypothetical protein
MISPIHPIPQWPEYHNFVDTRALFGIPNTLNVLSNIPFVIAGIIGIIVTRRTRFTTRSERTIWRVIFAAAIATGLGSAWYHLSPGNDSLVWDRLPMSISFMAILCAIISETISPRLAIRLLIPLIGLGMSSVLYWTWTEHHGIGDLRPYALVQFLPMPLIIFLLGKYRTPYTHVSQYGIIIAWYIAAKLLEALDDPIFSVGKIVSGHTLKHLAAAAGIFQLAWMLQNREPREEVVATGGLEPPT